MNIETIRDYCLEKPGVTEAFPFDGETLVFRLGDTPEKHGRIFALCALERPDYLLLKCEPERAEELRDRYPEEIEPGWHMNKRHWNGIRLGGPHLTDGQICEMIDHAYGETLRALPKRQRMEAGL
ncbi:MmcQ/YjbR family DNA-binding protein [uncultured Rikenella sp.]|uniref:MmcQ/YjbR family DNA-binding protein n=1 Tax=uncultured Rikenella sp. TaxID=368003 RepID=UPI0025F5DE9A|nr:MmcQ/YjbR family DNA-binding protein [uncultured Rikenella sp.]